MSTRRSSSIRTVSQHRAHRVVLEELVGVRRRGERRPAGEGDPLLRALPTSREADRFRSVRRHPLRPRRRGALHEERVRAPRPAGLWHESQRQATVKEPRGDIGILRDCTPGLRITNCAVKIQSDPHGDMGSAAEMTAPLHRHEVDEGVTNVPKVGMPRSSERGQLPPIPVTVWVQPAICWKLRVSGGTRPFLSDPLRRVR